MKIERLPLSDLYVLYKYLGELRQDFYDLYKEEKESFDSHDELDQIEKQYEAVMAVIQLRIDEIDFSLSK